MDYARILISTPSTEIVNTMSEFFIDGCKYVIKIVEEWGCCLGEDAFMSDEVTDSNPETVAIDNVEGIEEV